MLQNLASPAALAALVSAVAIIGLSGCGGGKGKPKESLLDKIPTKEAVILVGDKKVSGAWLRNFCANQELQLLKTGMPVKIDEYSMVKAGLDILTKIVVVAAEAERRGLTVSDEEIADKLSEEMKAYPSTEAWRERLEASGLSVDERKEQIRLEALFHKFRDQIVRPDVERDRASEEMAREFYDKFPEKFTQPRAIHVLHLMRSVAKDAPQGERDRERQSVDEARNRVAKGEKFEDVAREVSTDVSAIKGGDIGWVNDQTPMPEEMRAAILALKPNEMSDVFESPLGYHIFDAVDVQEEGKVPFEKVKADIQKQLLDRALSNAMERTVATLRQQTEIKWIDPKSYLGEPPPQPGPGGPPPAQPSAPPAPPTNS